MKWRNLLNNRCPKCNNDMMNGLDTFMIADGMIKVLKHPCGFRISEDRFNEIVQKMVEKGLSEFTHDNDEYEQNDIHVRTGN